MFIDLLLYGSNLIVNTNEDINKLHSCIIILHDIVMNDNNVKNMLSNDKKIKDYLLIIASKILSDDASDNESDTSSDDYNIVDEVFEKYVDEWVSVYNEHIVCPTCNTIKNDVMKKFQEIYKLIKNENNQNY